MDLAKDLGGEKGQEGADYGSMYYGVDPRYWRLGFRLLGRKDHYATKRAMQALEREGRSAGGDDRFSMRRLLMGVPEGPEELPTNQTLPLNANLDGIGGISYTKGCYMGQELTTRTYRTGVIRKRLFILIRPHKRHRSYLDKWPHNAPLPAEVANLTDKTLALELLRRTVADHMCEECADDDESLHANHAEKRRVMMRCGGDEGRCGGDEAIGELIDTRGNLGLALMYPTPRMKTKALKTAEDMHRYVEELHACRVVIEGSDSSVMVRAPPYFYDGRSAELMEWRQQTE